MAQKKGKRKRRRRKRVEGLGSIDYLYVMGLEAEVAITKPAADKLGAEYCRPPRLTLF